MYNVDEKIKSLKEKAQRIIDAKSDEKIIVLGIESSCDETSIAVVVNGVNVLSNVVATQIPIHKEYGGVVPEIASRKHVEAVVPVLEDALENAGIKLNEVDAVAVTYGAGLVGALLVGLNFAKGLAYALNVPLVPINHIAGHICGNFVAKPDLRPPFISLVVSGGHTAIIYQKTWTEQELIGQTRDDAIGECYDKVARVLGLQYPGGVKVDKLAKDGENNIIFRKSNVLKDEFDFSFSGLKTAVINYVHTKTQKGEDINLADVCCSFQTQAIDEIIEKTIRATMQCGLKTIAIAGGVSANSYLRENMRVRANERGIEVVQPDLSLCGDNAGMIASAGFFKLAVGCVSSDLTINACPSLKIGSKSIITD